MPLQLSRMDLELIDANSRSEKILAAIAKAISHQVREHRVNGGLTQKQLANKIGTGQSAVARYEDGTDEKFTLRTIARLANALDCDLQVTLQPKDKTMENLLQFFAYEHLPAHLQTISKPFGDLAKQMSVELPANPESTAAMRKLLEAKDCAVRAILFKKPA